MTEPAILESWGIVVRSSSGPENDKAELGNDNTPFYFVFFLTDNVLDYRFSPPA
jgi:hypothetical protein